MNFVQRCQSNERNVRWWWGWRDRVTPEYAEGLGPAQADGWRNCGVGSESRFFLIPHWVTTAFMAAWAPPRSMCVVALRICSGEPVALGNNQQGLRCLHHKARNALNRFISAWFMIYSLV